MLGGDETTIAKLCDAAVALRSVTTPATSKAKVLRTAIDVLSSDPAVTVAEIDETRAYEAEGASSITTWARRELGQDAGQAGHPVGQDL